MHTLLDYEGALPALVNIANEKSAENKRAYEIRLIKKSVIVADRYHDDLPLLLTWNQNGAKFVIRHKENMQYRVIKENPLSENRAQHILKDQIIEFKGDLSRKKYPGKLSGVSLWDVENNQVMGLTTKTTAII